MEEKFSQETFDELKRRIDVHFTGLANQAGDDEVGQKKRLAALKARAQFSQEVDRVVKLARTHGLL